MKKSFLNNFLREIFPKKYVFTLLSDHNLKFSQDFFRNLRKFKKISEIFSFNFVKSRLFWLFFLKFPKITTFLGFWRYRQQQIFVATEVSKSTTLAIYRQIWDHWRWTTYNREWLSEMDFLFCLRRWSALVRALLFFTPNFFQIQPLLLRSF